MAIAEAAGFDTAMSSDHLQLWGSALGKSDHAWSWLGAAPAILQIFHAGVKVVPELVLEVVAASGVPGDPGLFNSPLTPRALTDEEVLDVIQAFGQATRRAILAGFDGIELHGAHDFLIQNFLSSHFNRRADRWGGSLENRMRFPLAVVAAVREAIAVHADRPFVLGYRVSPEESNEGGLRIADVLVLVERLIDAGIDYIHASHSSALEARPIGATDGPTIPRLLLDRIGGRVPLIAAGQVRTLKEAERAIASGLSVVAIGQGLVMNPDWIDLARSHRHDAITQSITVADVGRLAVPAKLWAVIEATPGWFKVMDEAST